MHRLAPNLRSYGRAPFSVGVVHGGPGAAGEMAPVARQLAGRRDVLEPLQTESSLDGQIEELRLTVNPNGDLPLTLIGFSWGAWLSYIVAARHPECVSKLILVASGPFEDKYLARLRENRMARLTAPQRTEYQSLVAALDNPVLGDPVLGDRDTALARLGTLASRSSQYDPLPDERDESEALEIRGDIFQGVWKEAARLRTSGELLALGTRIECPVVAIHGDCDPHPAEGVREPLSRILPDFRFITLENCGHKP